MTDQDPRFAQLDAALKTIKDDEAQKNAAPLQSDAGKAADGMRIGAELVAGPLAGGGLGYAIDSYFHTKPIFLIALLILGVITGFVNVWRLSNGYGSAIGYKKQDPNA